MADIIRATGLNKSFQLSAKQQKLENTKERVIRAVSNLSFTAEQGEIFGLLGPNGAGKTTTLRMLATLIKPDSGDAVLDGASIAAQPGLVRAKIGFLTSELKLEDFFTPNYLYNFFAALHGIDPAIRDERKRPYSTIGINEFAEVKVANLSSGMKQKASLAISWCTTPASSSLTNRRTGWT